jgi:hypothetical protein
MPRIVWNNSSPSDPPNDLIPRNVATIYSSTDGEIYKGYHIARGADPSITKDGSPVPGLEGIFTTYNLAKAAIDRYIAKSTIKDVIAISSLS